MLLSPHGDMVLKGRWTITGDTIILKKEFRVVILAPAEGENWKIDLQSGDVDVLSEGPHVANSGDANLSALSTAYGIRVYRMPDGQPKQEWIVYDGGGRHKISQHRCVS